MSRFLIEGGKPLIGKIKVAGNKNSVLKIMAASVLIKEDVILENVPDITDVWVMVDILKNLGAKVESLEKNTLVINTKNIKSWKIEERFAKKLRASIIFLGPLLARFGIVELSHPGGDIIGKRSIETHLEGFASLGASISLKNNNYLLKMKNKKSFKNEIFLDEPSVTATENLIMGSLFNKEEVKIENVALEPHVNELIEFLNKAGAKIKKEAGEKTIIINAGRRLKGIRHKILPDHIEIGTFAVLSAVTNGQIEIYPVVVKDLKITFLILSRMGVKYKLKGKSLQIYASNLKASPKRIQAGPWPSFPTDLMSSFIVLASQAKGQTLFHDPMYESRMFFVDKLIRMGAHITICDPHRVIVYGPSKLIGRNLNSPDIRAGMALVIAALAAKDKSIIDNAQIIERGYEDLEGRLGRLGAKIKKLS